MTKRVAELQEMISPKEKGIREALSRRLKAMERQISTIARTGGGIGSAEVDKLGEDLRTMVAEARAIEKAPPARPVLNTVALDAHARLFDGLGAIEGAMRGLRERIEESDPDPDGMILASIRVGQSIIASAEAILVGKMQS